LTEGEILKWGTLGTLQITGGQTPCEGTMTFTPYLQGNSGKATIKVGPAGKTLTIRVADESIETIHELENLENGDINLF